MTQNSDIRSKVKKCSDLSTEAQTQVTQPLHSFVHGALQILHYYY